LTAARIAISSDAAAADREKAMLAIGGLVLGSNRN
jgi:hypothetical protein